MKLLIILAFFLNSIFVFSQSKKEQIELLQNQLDSMKIEMSHMKQREDSIIVEMKAIEFVFEKLIQNMNTSIQYSNDSISKEIDKIKRNQTYAFQKLDSILKPKVLLILDDRFVGKWQAYSKVYWGTGDFQIFDGIMTFKNEGIVNYELIDFNGQEYLIKIDIDIDNSKQFYMKLGVIYSEGDENYMEVAFYDKELDGRRGMLKTIGEGGKYGSWGLYTRK